MVCADFVSLEFQFNWFIGSDGELRNHMQPKTLNSFPAWLQLKPQLMILLELID